MPNERKFAPNENVLDAFRVKYGEGSGYDSYHESNGCQSPLPTHQWRAKNSKLKFQPNQNAQNIRTKIIQNISKTQLTPELVYQTYASTLSNFVVSIATLISSRTHIIK